MKLLKFMKIVFICTVLCLAYIHLQVKIIQLAYKGKAKEDQIRRLIDDNGSVTYSILKLKSTNNLGVKMLAENSDMNFIDPDNIIPVVALRDAVDETIAKRERDVARRRNPLLSLLSLDTQAEARVNK